MFIVEFPVAACCNEPKNVPTILINWLNVKNNYYTIILQLNLIILKKI